MPPDASSQNRGTLKDQRRSWKIFGSKQSQAISSPGINSLILSDAYTQTVSFSIQIKISTGRPCQCAFSAIFIASSRTLCEQCFQITDSSYCYKNRPVCVR
ncbi:hypothetical protein AVEN_142744-1 [Araneus ventricosus]|uniref:Uncharacterized protein n=1 Tax=Araneus ventricosus TaxID=182803 RepID=A0A4Y2TGS0_ARAVE|nr:hypothetical protein AVEN_261086-1 [Araneus ventricosus]GBN98986.1 hypothetical protein AVEN_142744-1 [Araneus ventricosus]